MSCSCLEGLENKTYDIYVYSPEKQQQSFMNLSASPVNDEISRHSCRVDVAVGGRFDIDEY